MADDKPEEFYAGNLLPTLHTSMFQWWVSLVYAVFTCCIFLLGALAVASAQKDLNREIPPHRYMRLLVRKHNAIVHGVLVFIPACYCVAHLFTTSLHNGNLFSSSQVILVAILGFAAQYLGQTLTQLVRDSDAMDVKKVAYESLYLCAVFAERLRLHSRGESGGVRDLSVRDLEQLISGVTDCKSITQDIFLLTASSDDSRLWRGYWRWLCSKVVGINCCQGQAQTPHGFWLFSQDNNIRTYTGFMLVNNDIPKTMGIASYHAQKLYYAAWQYIAVVSQLFQSKLASMDFSGLQLQCKTGALNLGGLRQSLLMVIYEGNAMNMAAERYACRRTPVMLGKAVDQKSKTPCEVFKECVELIYGRTFILTSCGKYTEAEGNCCTAVAN